MSSVLTAPDPSIFSEDVRRFAEERGVLEYLVPLFELSKKCFDGGEVHVLHEHDPEIAGLQWIVLEVAAADWEPDRYHAAHDRWLTEFHRICPAPARAAFVLGER